MSHWKFYTLVLLALAAGPTLAQEWAKARIVIKPGVGAGPIKVGENLSPEAKAYLGNATKTEPPNESVGGYALFGKGDARDLVKGFRIRLGDLKNPERTTAIEVRGLRASTEEGVFLGGGTNLITAKYPQAQKDTNPYTGRPEYTIPGLVMQINNDKVSQFIIEPTSYQAWRFQDLRVIAGQSAGSITLGKVIPPEAYQLLGNPTHQVKPGHSAYSGIVRWSLAGQSPTRLIEVVLHDGIRPKVVTQIRLRGVSALTDRKIKIGDGLSAVQSVYPEGRQGIHSGGGETWRIPGLTFVLRNGKVTDMEIYKIEGSKRKSHQ